MCGIFGTIRPRRYALRYNAALALLELGVLAEERGLDSSGVAIFDGNHRPASGHRTAAAPLVDLVDGRWRQILSEAPFGQDIPSWPRVVTDLRKATIVLGHTRWATRGDVTLTNASPVRVGPVIGTHNGDIDVPADYPRWRTDTAFLFRQLTKAHGAAQIAAILTALRGRAGLAWCRIDQPGHVHIARTALSPVWLTRDRGGAIWWASNPVWLRTISRVYDLDMADPWPVREGSYLLLRSDRDAVDPLSRKGFRATCRPQDQRIASIAAWRGFSRRDRDLELDIADHAVNQPWSEHQLDALG